MGGRGLAGKPDNFRVARIVKTLKSSNLSLWIFPPLVAGGWWLLPPTDLNLSEKPTPCPGPPPGSLAIRPVFGPEYLFSDVDGAMTGQLKLGKVFVPLLIRTFTSWKNSQTLWEAHTGTLDLALCEESIHTWTDTHTGDLPLASSGGVPSTDVFDVLCCLLLHQHKAIFVCLVHGAA